MGFTLRLINPSLTVYEKYSNVHIINPYKPESLVMKSVSLTRASSQYLTVSPNAALELSTFSVVIWVRVSTAPASSLAVCAYAPKGAHADGRGFWISYSSSNKIAIQWGDADGTWSSITESSTSSTNTWYCVLFTFNGTGELFINNVSKGTATDGIIYTDGSGSWPNAKLFAMGAHDGPAAGFQADYFHDGLLTGFAIFNVALTSDQRTWLYNSGQLRNYAKADFYSNCVMYLPFNDSYDDYTGNGRNATAVNSPTFDSTIPQ